MGIWPYDGDESWLSPFEDFIIKVIVISIIFILAFAGVGEVLTVFDVIQGGPNK